MRSKSRKKIKPKSRKKIKPNGGIIISGKQETCMFVFIMICLLTGLRWMEASAGSVMLLGEPTVWIALFLFADDQIIKI